MLICADKFQTGYDEPLLHTMCVDKPLSGIKAVQTLSRLNRAHPQKYDVFVVDFMNDADTITEAFADYYRTTILSEETDPNRLHDLELALDRFQVYSREQVARVVELYLDGASREKLEPTLNECVATYCLHLDEEGRVDFKGKAKAFARTYDFLETTSSSRLRSRARRTIAAMLTCPRCFNPNTCCQVNGGACPKGGTQVQSTAESQSSRCPSCTEETSLRAGYCSDLWVQWQ